MMRYWFLLIEIFRARLNQNRGKRVLWSFWTGITRVFVNRNYCRNTIIFIGDANSALILYAQNTFSFKKKKNNNNI